MKILLNAATHGDEKIGLRVAKALKKLNLKKGEIIYTLANPAALRANKRYIYEDLNRAFPGKRTGNYEQRRAYELSPLIKSCDIVFDIHSTTSSLKDALIVTKLTKETKKIIEIISPKYVLIMNVTRSNALISQAKIGIAFEYGKDKSPKCIKDVTSDIKKILAAKSMIPTQKSIRKFHKLLYFKITKTVTKPRGYRLAKNIQNYRLVKKGELYAMSPKGSRVLYAEKDFYPILFGEKNYKEYFGFAGTQLT